MFSDKFLSIQIAETMLSINTLLERSRSEVWSGSCTEDERKRYLKKVSNIMAITTLEILQDIWSIHPDIVPAEFKEAVNEYESWRKEERKSE